MNTKENRKMPSFVGPLAAVVVLSVVLTVSETAEKSV